MANEKQDFGSIIEQWFKRFEFVAKESNDIQALTKGKFYPLATIDFENRELSVVGDDGDTTEWFRFDDLPDYFEIRIREA